MWGRTKRPEEKEPTMTTYKFSHSALCNIEECGVDAEADVEALRSGATTRAALLEHCLDGADADRVGGWRDYVSTVALRAGWEPTDDEA